MQLKRPGLFEDWVAFHRTEPFGPYAQNLMLARVCSAMCGESESLFLLGSNGD
jgi:hypothetical protein